MKKTATKTTKKKTVTKKATVKSILYSHVKPTEKNWVKKTAKKLGVTESTVVQAAIKQARTAEFFAIK